MSSQDFWAMTSYDMTCTLMRKGKMGKNFVRHTGLKIPFIKSIPSLIVGLKFWCCCELWSFIYDLLHFPESFCNFLYPGILKFHDLHHEVNVFISFTLLDTSRELSIYMAIFRGLFSRVFTLWSFSCCWISGSRMQNRAESEVKMWILP